MNSKPKFDVFVSYSRSRYSREHDQTVDPWPQGLVDAIRAAKVEGVPLSKSAKFYLYQERDAGEDWQSFVASVCRSNLMIVLVSETYFESLTCFEEWHAFSTRDPSFGSIKQIDEHRQDKILPIWRFEEETQEGFPDKKSEMQSLAAKSIAAKMGDKGEPFTSDHKHLVQRWVDSVFGRNYLGDLSEDAENSASAFTKSPRLRRSVSQIAAKIHNHLDPVQESEKRTHELKRLIALCLLGLGLDRYNHGGWGFSMGSEFEIDDDGALLQRGRYELNLIVLRALQSILPADQFYKESEAALLWSLDSKLSGALSQSAMGSPRVAQSRVRDRKQRAAALATLLNSKSLPKFMTKLTRALDLLSEEILHTPVNQRWVIQQFTFSESYDDVVFFDFSSRALSLNEDPYLKGEIDKKAVKSGFDAAEASFRSWLRSKSPIKRIYNDAFLPLSNFTSRKSITEIKPGVTPTKSIELTREIDSLLLYVRMICSLSNGASILMSDGSTAPAIRKIAELLEDLVAQVKRVDAEPSLVNQFLRVFPIYCLSLNDLAHHDQKRGMASAVLQEHATACREIFFDLIDCLGASEIALRMNAAGWAATIILAERYQTTIEERLSKKIWTCAERARTHRKSAAIDMVRKPAAEARKGFDEFIEQEIIGIEKTLETEWLDLSSRPLEWRPMFSFGGNSANAQIAQDPRIGDAVGLLLVDGETDNVVAATAGFNAIYIQPFSARLGIGLNSLERMIFELGETDTDFINSLSESIVKKCWPMDRIGPNEDLQEADFSARSIEARQQVESQNLKERNDPGFSRRDLLELRTHEENESRFVLRTCSLIHPDDIVGVPSQEELEETTGQSFLIQWTFVDVTNWVNAGAFVINPAQTIESSVQS